MTQPDGTIQPAVTAVEARFDELRRKLGFVLGPAAFIVILLTPFPDLSPSAHRLAAISSLVIVLWVTESIPLPVTALLGPTLAVMLRVSPVSDAFAPMANPLIFLFIGSFILAQALFVHRVNERIAYTVLSWKLIGARPARILVAYGSIAAILSMWMSNTATTAMLLPIGLSLLAFMESEGKTPKSYGIVLMLITSYGCSLGGIGTPVGTPPNLIAIGMIENMVGTRITFVEWMLFALPVSAILMGLLFVYLNYVGRVGVREIPGAERIIRERKKNLGPLRPAERNAILAFGVTVSLWVIPGLLPLLLGRDHPFAQAVLGTFPESVAALIGAILLFVLPVSRAQRSTITWKQAAQIDWGTILLFGGGLSLGTMAQSTGLAESVGRAAFGLLPSTSILALTFAGALFGVVLSESMSNTAAANIAVPIVISIAQAAGVTPIAPAVAASLAASVAVVLPVSTPPNAIVYSSGKVPITQMVKYGLVVDAVAIVLIPIILLAVAPSYMS